MNRNKIIGIIGGMIFAGLMSVPAFADNGNGNSALPGTVNYVEGSVDLGNQALNAKSIGATTLEPGQTIVTNNGKAEILLTPGVFVRLGDNSALQLVSPNLTKTEVQLERGKAMVEVDEIHKDNDLLMADNGAVTQMQKAGLYEFNADSGKVLVFKGEAKVDEGDLHKEVKGGHELNVEQAKLKTTGFDKDKYEDSDLYKFSSLRSQYIADASANAAEQYAGAGWAPGWFWDPWYSAYTFFPYGGFMYSPFGWGWGFYSPAWIGYYGAPGFYHGHYLVGAGYGHGHVAPFRAGSHFARSTGGNLGFHGNSMAFHGGSMGGFHAGGGFGHGR